MSLRNASWLFWVVVGTLLCVGVSLIALVVINVNDNDITELRVPSKCDNAKNLVCDQPLVVNLTTNCKRSELTVEIYNPNASQAHYSFTYDQINTQGVVSQGWSTVASLSVSKGSHTLTFNPEEKLPVVHNMSC